MDKEPNQAIMVISELRNKFSKLKTEENRLAYFKEHNYCANLSSITDNDLFWKTVYCGKTVSPLFTEKMVLRTTK